MRRSERAVTDEKEILDIIKSATICNVGLNDNEFPYVVTMNYGYRENALYFHCAKEGKKIDLIKKDNRCGFQITKSEELKTGEQACQWTTKFCSIMGYGKISLVENMEGKRAGLNAIMEQHGKFDSTYSDAAINAVLVLKLDIESLTAKQS